MKLNCPKCGQRIPADKMNVEANVAVCSGCDEAFELSGLVDGRPDAAPESPASPRLHQAPPGAWFRADVDSWEVGAATRSLEALFLVPFIMVWSGFSLGGIYGPQILSGKFNLWLSLFGIPFIGGTCLFGSIALMKVCGKVTVTVCNDQGSIFTGVGPFGWTRRFRWSEVNRIVEDTDGSYRRNAGTTGKILQFEGETRLRFAGMVNDARRYFMLHVLKRMKAGSR